MINIPYESYRVTIKVLLLSPSSLVVVVVVFRKIHILHISEYILSLYIFSIIRKEIAEV